MRSAAVEETAYCCFGCRFAASVADTDDADDATRRAATRLGIAAFFAMNVMVFSMALWSEHLYDASRLQPLERAVRDLFRWLAFIGTVPVLLLLGVPLGGSAWRELSRRRPSMDVLVCAGVLAAFAMSLWHLWTGGPLYFEVTAMVLVLVPLGRWIEAQARLHAGRLLDRCGGLLPQRAVRLTSDGPRIVAPELLRPGDRIRLGIGERLAVDATLQEPAAAEFDTRLLTGESRPVGRVRGDEIPAGALAVSTDVTLVVLRPADRSRLAQILGEARRARKSRGRLQRLAERLTPWFTALVATTAAGTFLAHQARDGTETAILSALAVVLIACPCALTLATSLTVWTALQRAAAVGVLVRGGEALERLATVKAVRFDKTGTLTRDLPNVRAAFDESGRPLETARGPRSDTETPIVETAASAALPLDVLEEVRAAAAASPHPFSRAIARFLREFDERNSSFHGDNDRAGDRVAPLRSTRCGEPTTLPGRGLRVDRRPDGATRALSPAARPSGTCTESGRSVIWIGSRQLMDEAGCRISEGLRRVLEHTADEQSCVYVGVGGRVVAAFVIDDELRPEASQALAACRRLGLDVGVLSGDTAARVTALGRVLSVPAIGGCSPHQKTQHLRDVRATIGPVAMVGDGFNDAAALSAADVAVAMAAGVDLTRVVADVCLLNNDLRGFPWAVRLARRARTIIRQNLLWSFGYNTVGMLAAATGRLNPVLAAALMFVSSLVVLINAQRAAGVPAWTEPSLNADERSSPAVVGANRDPADGCRAECTESEPVAAVPTRDIAASVPEATP
ncbi:MAG: heavy metal translocating P-type ATPase [Planctomycetota bacterium]|nr:MAG: heavy metal translocating P-type ATPase [Planctomycetota bacterium]